MQQNERRNQEFIDLIKDFSLFIKQPYCLVWSVKKIKKVKIQKLQGQETEE